MQPPAGTRRSLGKVRGAQQTGVALDVLDQLALVPDVVAGREDVGAGIVQLAGQPLGQAETMRRVLRIDDHKIGGEVAPQRRQVGLDRLPPGPPDHIAEQKDVQEKAPA